MMVILKPHDDYKHGDAVLAYDAEEEELWGLEEYWKANADLVGLSEEEFAHFFPPPGHVAGKTDTDPFEDMPEEFIEEHVRNYPPGSEEIPDVPTREPPPSEWVEEEWPDE